MEYLLKYIHIYHTIKPCMQGKFVEKNIFGYFQISSGLQKTHSVHCGFIALKC